MLKLAGRAVPFTEAERDRFRRTAFWYGDLCNRLDTHARTVRKVHSVVQDDFAILNVPTILHLFLQFPGAVRFTADKASAGTGDFPDQFPRTSNIRDADFAEVFDRFGIPEAGFLRDEGDGAMSRDAGASEGVAGVAI